MVRVSRFTEKLAINLRLPGRWVCRASVMNSPRGDRGPHGAFSGRIIMAFKHLGENLSGNLY